MDFYDNVNGDNAIKWYSILPPHLKLKIDNKFCEYKSGKDAQRKDNPDIYAMVEKDLGVKPKPPADPVDPLEGWSKSQLDQWETYKRWVARYDEILLISVVTAMAHSVQTERRMLNEAMGLNVSSVDFPSQAEYLDPTQQATVRWLQSSGEMPLEFLARTYRNEDAKMGDRITAARTLMDYAHKKVPVKTEVETQDITKPKLSAKVLKGLTNKELETLEKILSKLGETDE